MNLRAIQRKDTRYAVGLAAAPSGYGIHAALVRLRGTGSALHMKLVRCQVYPFRSVFRSRLLASHADAREIALLNFELGELFAEAAIEMIRAGQEEPVDVDFIALQGFPLAHIPPRGTDPYGMLAIGEPSVVAERTGLTVVSDFAQRDMAGGGQGAPMSAYPDWALFARPERTVACLHLGAVASLTVVTPKLEHVLAFDVGPGTGIIDEAMRYVTGGSSDFDQEGQRAAQGSVLPDLLERLSEHRYFERIPPKSCSRAEFGGETYLREAFEAHRQHEDNDLIATVTAAVAENIVEAYIKFVRPTYRVVRVVVTGGGAYNRTLMRRIEEGLRDVTFRTGDQYGLPLHCEGVYVAILGNELICDTPADVSKATGVRMPALLGRVTPGRPG